MKTSTEGYAHPEMLADTDWLFAHLHDPAIRIVDTEPRVAALMADLSISDDTLVVAYDAASGLFATRLWWALNRISISTWTPGVRSGCETTSSSSWSDWPR